MTADFEYSRVAYPGVAEGLIHPRNLETIAGIFGLKTAPLQNCRVLEIGCADGPNLLPDAAEFPKSTFVGLDLATDRITEAQQAAQQCGITNAQFHGVNVAEFAPADGPFDYILCPGVYSWATDSEREAILQLCSDHLSTRGVAAISFNVYPGWNQRGTVRELIRRHVRAFPDPQQQIVEARKAAAFIARNTSRQTSFGLMYDEALQAIQRATDHYLFHDYISDRNQPFYFHQFADHLESFDLQFVAECDMTHTAAMGLPPEAAQTLNRTSISDREQLLDFLVNTVYRRSLICRSGRPVTRTIDYRVMQDLHVALINPLPDLSMDAASRDPVTVQYQGGSMTVIEPLGKAAIQHLRTVWPRSVAVADLFEVACQQLPSEFHHPNADDPDQLVDGSAVLARSMLAAFGAGLVQAWKTAPHVFPEVSERPLACSYSRWCAVNDHVIVNGWHQNILTMPADQRFVLSLLDGQRTLADLQSEWQQWRADRAASEISAAGSTVATILNELANQFLVIRR